MTDEPEFDWRAWNADFKAKHAEEWAVKCAKGEHTWGEIGWDAQGLRCSRDDPAKVRSTYVCAGCKATK